jgi:hypothetical protein
MASYCFLDQEKVDQLNKDQQQPPRVRTAETTDDLQAVSLGEAIAEGASTTALYLGCHIAHQTQKNGGFTDSRGKVYTKAKLKYDSSKDEQEGIDVNGEDDC